MKTIGTMQRLPDWGLRLRKVIRDWEKKENFSFGHNDCIQLGLDVSTALFDKELFPFMRESYTTFKEGLILLRRHYPSVQEGLVAQGAHQIQKEETRLGDIGLSWSLSGEEIIHLYLRQGKSVTFNYRGIVDTSGHIKDSYWRL